MIDVQGSIFDLKSIAIATVVGFAILLALYPDRCIGSKPRKDIIAAQPSYPLVGNLGWLLNILLQKTRLLDEVYRLQTTQAHGYLPITLTFPALGFRVTAINNPAYIEYIQKTNFSNFEKGPEQRRIMHDVLSVHGIFASDGDIWQKQRKLASNIFSIRNFNTHVQATVLNELKMLDTLLKDATKKNTPINFPDVMFRFTLNSFGSMAFGADIDCMPKTVEGLQIPNEFAVAFDKAQEMMDHRIFALLPQWTEMFTTEGRQHKKNVKILSDYCYRIIDLRLAKREKEGNDITSTDKSGKDLLELFMDRGLNRKELLPVILNFLIAGRDTTAQTLAWLFTELYKSPEYIDKIREHIAPVLGEPADQRSLTYDEMKDLPFLQACFYEASRLWPAVPKNVKYVVADDVIRPNRSSEKSTVDLPDVVVKAKEHVMFSDFTMARLPVVWGDDAEQFKPERFLEKDEEGRSRVKEFSPFKFHSFNAGPRMCLGKTLAVYEGMAVTAAILGQFDVVFDEQKMRNDPPTYGDSLTLPCTPYNVQFRKRKV